MALVVSRTRAENQMETCGVHLDGTLFFYLRRGELPGCRLWLQRGVAPNAYRLALLYARNKQGSKLQKRGLLLSLHSSWSWRDINQMLKSSFEPLSPVIRTICLT